MLTRIIARDDAVALIRRQEDHFYDQKAQGVSGAQLQKALVAFGNADGGELVVGIEDAQAGATTVQRWQGHATIEDFNGLVQALHSIEPSLPCSMTFLACQDLPGVLLFASKWKALEGFPALLLSITFSTSGTRAINRSSARWLDTRIRPTKIWVKG